MIRRKLTAILGFLLLSTAISGGCIDENDEPAGLRSVQHNGGPRILFDLDARPFPDVPFPNDVATRVDPDSPTGKRVNVSTQAPTKLERDVRKNINTFDGFGVYAPISVSFDAPLDLDAIVDRHHEPVPNFDDDAVYVVNIDPESPGYGEFVQLDMGRGNFPVNMKEPDNYFDFDPRANGTNLIVESVKEVDENGNGRLDPIEDTDDDGVWDEPNTLRRGADPWEFGQMMSFYERETDTLIMRPTDTLRPATTYAVVLTDALRGENGKPIESPFPFINHARQTPDLAPLRTILPRAHPDRFGPDLDNIQFAWSFTTQSTTLELRAIRAGLYGHGTMSYLAQEFPAELALVHTPNSPDNEEEPMTIVLGNQLLGVLLDALAGGLGSAARDLLTEALGDVDYIVSGSFRTPYFIADKDGFEATPEEIAQNINQMDADESFDVDPNTGDAAYGVDEVTWHCAIPKAKEGRQPPFPVVIYGHGYGSSRIEGLGFAGQMAKFGLATCAMDNTGHGLRIPEEFLSNPLLEGILESNGLEGLTDVLQHGRHRDLTNDGLADSGGDFWTADTFHTRDMLRQSQVDYMQFIRILRSWDGEKRFPDEVDEDDPFVKVRRHIVSPWDHDGDGESELAGDFNADGVVDIGGEQPVYAWGQSLGGIQAALLPAMDPVVRGGGPTSGGAGLTDIGIRSTQGGVPEAVILRMMGPVLLGRPMEQWNAEEETWEYSGETRLEFLIPDAFDETYLPFATVDNLQDGDRIVFRNLEREKRPELVEPEDLDSRATVRSGSFRTGIAADAVATNERRYRLGFDPNVSVADLHRRNVSPEEGLTAQYFHRRNHRRLAFERVEGTIDASWDEGEEPAEGFNPDAFSVRWRGILRADYSETYTLELDVDGHAEVFIDGFRVLSERDGVYEERTTLEKGRDHTIRVDFTQEGGAGHIRLTWSSSSQSSEIIPADALQTHLPLTEEEQAEYQKHIIDNAREWGDPFVVEIHRQDGTVEEITTFEHDVVYQNVLYPAGTPLAALSEGWGIQRQTPEFRKFFAIAQMILARADPAAFAPHYFERPLRFDYETPMFQDGTSNVVVIPTVGDTAVPVATGISIARIAGILDDDSYDARYDTTANDYLIQNHVYEGIWWLDRFPDYPGTLFDADDLDRGRYVSDRYPERGDDPNADARYPVRATVETSTGMSGMRMPYLDTHGEHGFDLPKPSRPFDIDTFMANQLGYFFATDGKVLSDDPCMEKMFMEECDFFDYETWQRPQPQ